MGIELEEGCKKEKVDGKGRCKVGEGCKKAGVKNMEKIGRGSECTHEEECNKVGCDVEKNGGACKHYVVCKKDGCEKGGCVQGKKGKQCKRDGCNIGEGRQKALVVIADVDGCEMGGCEKGKGCKNDGCKIGEGYLKDVMILDEPACKHEEECRKDRCHGRVPGLCKHHMACLDYGCETEECKKGKGCKKVDARLESYVDARKIWRLLLRSRELIASTARNA